MGHRSRWWYLLRIRLPSKLNGTVATSVSELLGVEFGLLFEAIPSFFFVLKCGLIFAQKVSLIVVDLVKPFVRHVSNHWLLFWLICLRIDPM